MKYSIKKVNKSKDKIKIAEDILSALPDWFGDKKAIEDYKNGVKNQKFWAAFNYDQTCIGFISIDVHYDQTGEIYVMGVLPNFQHVGIGKALFSAAEKFLLKNKHKYIIVKTLSEKSDYAPYKQTRNFYSKMGFDSLVTIPEIWDEENPCLIMLKSI